MIRIFLAALAVAFGCAPALSQSAFPTVGGSYVDGHALMCPNGSTDFQGRPIMVPCGGSSNPVVVTGGGGGGGSAFTVSHASTTALANNLNAKASSGSLLGFNCSGITGGSAGFCVAYNGATTPGTGALTGANVLDFCQFDTTARGCSLSRAPSQVAYSAGIQILVTSAASPYTYTTGTDTAAVSADFQ